MQSSELILHLQVDRGNSRGHHMTTWHVKSDALPVVALDRAPWRCIGIFERNFRWNIVLQTWKPKLLDTCGFPVNITSCKNLYINKILCEMLGKMHLSLLFYSAYFEDFSFVFETVWSNLTMRSLILILIITDRDRLTNPLLLLQSHLSPETESVRRGPAGLRFGAAAGAEQQESLLQTSPGF